MATVEELESAAYDTWTPDEWSTIGDWTLCAADGFTRRLNCATACGTPSTDSVTRQRIVSWLTERGGAGVIRVTPLLASEATTAIEVEWGYVPRDRTVVMTARADGTYDDTVRMVDVADRGFFDDINSLNDRRDTSIPAWQRLLNRVRSRAAGMWVPDVAAGLVVHSGPLAGVYSVAVRPDAQRQGIATRMMDTAAAWAADRGADTMFLQVHSENSQALGLYDALGYRTAYEYSYLQEPEESRNKVIDGC